MLAMLFCSRSSHARSLVAIASSILFSLFFIPRASAQSPGQQPGAAPSSGSSSSSTDAAAKAAERKKRFEEMKRSLENKNSEPPPLPRPSTARPEAPAGPSYANDQPIFELAVTMFVGETQRFALFDDTRHNLTAQANWTVTDPSVAELSINGGVPSLVGKKPGTVFVLAHAKSQTARVNLSVLDRAQMTGGVIRWNQNDINTQAPLQIVPAIPIFGASH
jgi:hypothetical protein